MKISFAITVSNELIEIKRLLPFLVENKRVEDEIVILFDEKNGDNEVQKFLESFNNISSVKVIKDLGFNYNFAEWKNKLNSYCTGDFIFQLDADEMISEYMVKNVNEIITLNPETELYFLPRVNYVEGITEEHITKWGWNVDEKGRINFPDFQGRLFKKGLLWVGKVHERIVGVKYYSLLPSDESEYCIEHIKTINKQESQNDLYSKL